MAVRVAYVLATPGYRPAHDDRAYDLLARGVARTGAYPLLAGYPTAYRPPGYTYFLGALYWISGSGHAGITAARLVQAVVGTVSVALLGWLAAELFGRAAALCTMAIAAVYLPLVAVGASLLADGQSVALELAAIAAVVAWRRRPSRLVVALAGMAGGLAALTRSNGFVILPALLLGFLWPAHDRRWRPRAGAALAVVAIAAAVVAPWTIRNSVVLHSFIPVSDEAGGTLAGTYNPVSDHDGSAPAYWHLLSQIPSYQAETAPLASGPEPPFQSRLLDLAVSYAEHHPGYVGRVAFYNTERLAGIESLSSSRYTAGLAGITSHAVANACLFVFWAIGALAVGGAAISGVRRRVPGFVWVAAGLLYLSIALVNSETPRLRLPLDPFILLLAGAAVATLTGSRRRRLAGAEPGHGGLEPVD